LLCKADVPTDVESEHLWPLSCPGYVEMRDENSGFADCDLHTSDKPERIA